jgi:uncharacterized membrane protein
MDATAVMTSLADLRPGILALLLLTIVVLAVEVGFAMGKRRPSTDASASALQGIILTLVGLLLGFMFSFAAQRYDIRRDIAVREANAIGTTYLRADFVKDPAGSELRRDLARYLDVRIEFYESSSPAVRKRLMAETGSLQNRLWTLATTTPLTEPVTAHATLLTATMNDVFDRAEEQVRAFASGVPPPIVLLLFVVAAISGWLLGYGLGRVGKPDRTYTLTFAVLVSFVAYAIADLSQAQQGLIHTSSAALHDVRSSLSGAERPPPR